LAYLTMARAPRERLRWITLILAVRVIRLGDDPAHEVANIIEQLPDELRACAMASGFIKRGTRWAGVVEIDLLHPRLLGGAVKRDLISLLAGVDPDTLTPDQRVIVVHLHGVIDCKGHLTPDKFLKDARRWWPGARRVHSASIWTEGTVTENLERLASYSTKLRFQYSQSWDGTKTKFFMPYEPAWKAWMHRLHDNLGLSNMIISSVSSRASECTRDDEELVAAQGFDADDESLQLNVPDTLRESIRDNLQETPIKTLIRSIMTRKNNDTPSLEGLPEPAVSTNDPSSRGRQAPDARGHSRNRTRSCDDVQVDPPDGARPAARGDNLSHEAVDSRAIHGASRSKPEAPAEHQGRSGNGQPPYCRHQVQDRSLISDADDTPPPWTGLLVDQVPIPVDHVPQVVTLLPHRT
jgi:hypothetical protein